MIHEKETQLVYFLFRLDKVFNKKFIFFCTPSSTFHTNGQGRRDRGGGWGRVPPSCFGKFGHNFLRFWEKIYIKFSPILGENNFQIFSNFETKYLSNFLQFRENMSFKFSSILGENIFQICSNFGRKYLSNFLQFSKKISFKFPPISGEHIFQICSNFGRK
jgi:hypothetical protein